MKEPAVRRQYTPQKCYKRPAAAPLQHSHTAAMAGIFNGPARGGTRGTLPPPRHVFCGAGLLWAHRLALPAPWPRPTGWASGRRPDTACPRCLRFPRPLFACRGPRPVQLGQCQGRQGARVLPGALGQGADGQVGGGAGVAVGAGGGPHQPAGCYPSRAPRCPPSADLATQHPATQLSPPTPSATPPHPAPPHHRKIPATLLPDYYPTTLL